MARPRIGHFFRKGRKDAFLLLPCWRIQETMAGKGGKRDRNRRGDNEEEDDTRRRRLEEARRAEAIGGMVQAVPNASLAPRLNFHPKGNGVPVPRLDDTQYLVGGNSSIPKGDRFPHLSDDQIRVFVTPTFTCACCLKEKNSFEGPVHRKSITGMQGTCFGLCTTLAG